MKTTPASFSRFLVVGGTGKSGSRVATRLRDAGYAVRIGSRSASPRFAWEDASSFAPCLANVDAAFIAYHPDLAFPGAPEHLRGFGEAATRAGVKRLVLLSGRGEPAAERAENALRGAHANVVVLRCSWFAQNFGESFLYDDVMRGCIALPARDVAEPFVDLEDVADAAVVALTSTTDRARYELTGRRAWTFTEAAELFTRTTGRPVVFATLTAAAYVDGAVAAGGPSEVAQGLASLFAEVLDGRNAQATSDLRALLGREPRDLGDYVARVGAQGAWRA